MNKKRTIWVIGTVGGGGMSIGAAFLVLASLMVVMLSSGSPGIVQACAPSNPTGGSGVLQANAKKAAKSIPRNYFRLYKKIGRERNIPWNILAGIGKIETDHGRTTLPGVHSGENYAGAGGPMQFLASSWKAYGADGNGDGKKDRYEPADAILGATNHLRGSIGKKDPSIDLSPSDIRRAVHRYNPGYYTPQSNPYANDVLAAANRYADGYNVTSANYAGTSICSGAMTLASGSFGQRIAYAAAYYAKKERGTPRPPERKNTPTPYSWGGGTLKGPSGGFAQGAGIVGFDCSALARHAVYKASKGKVVLPRTTHLMWDGNQGAKVPRRNLAPGDLVFFNRVKHMAIYYGEINGVRWMVEARETGTDIMFSKLDERSDYVGTLRIKPPTGMGGEPPDVIRAIAPAGSGVGEGAM